MAVEGNTRNRVNGERDRGTAESKTPSMSGNHKRENREIPAEAGRTHVRPERTANATGGNADRLTAGKSDESVVPATSTNNDASEASAESTEERDSIKRNAKQTDASRTPSREHDVLFGLHGVREAARKDSKLKFTALLHHVSEDCLRNAFFDLKKDAAVGVDGEQGQAL